MRVFQAGHTQCAVFAFVHLHASPSQTSCTSRTLHTTPAIFTPLKISKCLFHISGHLTFKSISGNFLNVRFLRAKIVIPSFKTFTAYVLFRFHAEKKNDFSKADLGISLKNRIQPDVKINSDGEIL